MPVLLDSSRKHPGNDENIHVKQALVAEKAGATSSLFHEVLERRLCIIIYLPHLRRVPASKIAEHFQRPAPFQHGVLLHAHKWRH